ncbi:DUF2336 domain-containing protein [Sneathiella chungangensis]|uniref:DUF2336 domain-containing protein n=1 Tax=Sneathiella chungangensis TaxID=1418234 RepID=A0A845MH21_9PROT|nr:DUF2336 domain-containing protein [Sneathiella chungangensis]MZR23323.1 DUF2336 domain-containing protein [Sneathiella chungangensis]
MLVDSTLYGDRIAELFAKMPTPTRVSTARAAAEGFAAQNMADEDLALTQAIIDYFVEDIDVAVRQAIVDAVKDCEFLSHEIAMKLARDVDEISLPIVTHSPVLSDEDLWAILQNATNIKQTAIAGRPHLGVKSTAWIAEVGCYSAIKACLQNETAIIGKVAYNHILGRFGDIDPIQELLVHRPFLPSEIVYRLFDFISEEYKQILLDRNPVSESTSVRKILNAREKALAKTLDQRMTDHEQKKKSLALAREGRLTATLMLRLLIMGNHSFFAAALGHASGISKKRVVSLTSGRGYLGFQRLYDRAELPPYLYSAFRTAMEEHRKAEHYHPRADRDNFRQRLIDRIATIYGWEDGLSLEDLMEKLLPNRQH